MEHCAKCQTCNQACPIYVESGENDLYRPTYRSEALRRIYYKYVKGASTFVHGDIELNWKTVSRLIELAYRCNLVSPLRADLPDRRGQRVAGERNRKIASQEMGIAPREIHQSGSMLQLKVGSSTGMNSLVVKDNMEFIDEDTSEKTGIEVKTPWIKSAPISCSYTTRARSWLGRRIRALSRCCLTRPVSVGRYRAI